MSSSPYLQVVVGEDAHLRRGRCPPPRPRPARTDAALHDRVLDLEERVGDADHHEDDHQGADRLRPELTEAELPEGAAAEELAAAVQDAGDALAVRGRACRCRSTRRRSDRRRRSRRTARRRCRRRRAPRSRPPGRRCPCARRRSTDSTTITAAIEPMHGGGPRLHERTRCGDRHQAGEHAVAHHAGVGLAPSATCSRTSRSSPRTPPRSRCSPPRR